MSLSNVRVLFWKGALSRAIPLGSAQAPASTTNFQLAGTLILKNSAFLEVIGVILGNQASIDFFVSPTAFAITKALGSGGISLLDVVTLTGFTFSASRDGFTVLGNAILEAQWLSKGSPRPQVSFGIIVNYAGAFGISLSITELHSPFGIPGLNVNAVEAMVMMQGEALVALALRGTLKGPDASGVMARRVPWFDAPERLLCL